MASPFVEIRKLTKRYGEFTALSDLDLEIPTGEIFALLGPNGAGKTTTMRLLVGILKPTSGTARIGGLSCFENRVEVKRLIGFLPDDPIFHDYLRGLDIVRFVGGMHGLSSSPSYILQWPPSRCSSWDSSPRSPMVDSNRCSSPSRCT